MGDIVYCKFFLQGTCKYGDTCRFYHGRPTGGAVTNTSAFNPPQHGVTSYQSQNYGSNTSRLLSSFARPSNAQEGEIAAVLRTISQDMKEWEYSVIWPFSTYGPLSFRPSLPGCDDISDDELHYSYWMNGNTFPAELNMDQRYRETKEFWNSFSQVSARSIGLIKTLLATPIEPLTGEPTPLFLANYHPPPRLQPVPNYSSFWNNHSPMQGSSSNQSLSNETGTSFFGAEQTSRTNINNTNPVGSLASFNFTSASSSPATGTSFFGSGGTSSTSSAKPTGSLASFNFTSPSSAATSAPTMEVHEGGSTPKETFSFSLPTASVSPVKTSQPESAFTTFSFTQPLQPQLSTFSNRHNSQIADELMYSLDEELSPNDVAQFEAMEFDKIPFHAPSKRFC